MFHRSRASSPSIRGQASREIISDSVEPMRNWRLFLAHPTDWNNCSTFKNTQDTSWGWLWILKISRKIGVLQQTQSAMVCRFSHMTILTKVICVWWMCEINRFRRLSHAWVHFVIDRASFFTDHRMSSLPIRAMYKHSKTIWSIILTSLLQIPILPLWTDGRPNKDEKLCKVAPQCHLQIHSIVQSTFDHVLPCRRTTALCAREVSAIPVIFLLLQQTYVIRTSLCTVQRLFPSVCFLLECIPNTRGQEMMWVRQDQRSSSISSKLEPNSASFPPFLVSSEHTFSVRNFLPSKFWKLLPIAIKLMDDLTYFSSRGTTGSSNCPWCGPFVSWKTYPNIWTFWFWNFEQLRSFLQFYLGVRRYCISCLSLTTWQSWNNVHDLCSGHLWCRWALFSEDCVSSRIVLHSVSSEYDSAFILLQLGF